MKVLISAMLMAGSYWMQAQITLKKYDDPTIDAVESIVFEFSHDNLRSGNISGGKKIFNLEENNPYKVFSFQEIRDHGIRRILLSTESIQNVISENRPVITNIPKSAEIITNVWKGSTYAMVSYKILFYGDEEYLPLDYVVSKNVFLDEYGNIFKETDSYKDYYSVLVDRSKKYFVGAYGRGHYHSGNDLEAVFSIEEITNGNKIYVEKDATVLWEGESHEMLCYVISNRKGQWFYAFDPISGSLFRRKRNEIVSTAGYLKFWDLDGEIVGTEGFEKLR